MNRQEHFNAAQEALRKAAELTGGPREHLGKIFATRAAGHAQLAHVLTLDPSLSIGGAVAEAAATSPTTVRLRPWTPIKVTESGGLRLHAKRICNGCGLPLGDVTDEEMEAAISGHLMDVTDECQVCRANAALAADGQSGRVKLLHEAHLPLAGETR